MNYVYQSNTMNIRQSGFPIRSIFGDGEEHLLRSVNMAPWQCISTCTKHRTPKDTVCLKENGPNKAKLGCVERV